MLSLTDVSEYHWVGLDDAEYDFRDMRMAKFERQRRETGGKGSVTQDENLLEYHDHSVPTSKPSSPRAGTEEEMINPLQPRDPFLDQPWLLDMIDSQSDDPFDFSAFITDPGSNPELSNLWS